MLLWVVGLILNNPTAAAKPEVVPGVANENRARINYMLNCQGCHGPTAEGNDAADIPRMKDFVGSFFRVAGGREFLVQVPGSSSAAVDDAELAELLNWMIPYFSKNELPGNYAPYTVSEVSRLRRIPEEDVAGKRRSLVEAINKLDVPDSGNY